MDYDLRFLSLYGIYVSRLSLVGDPDRGQGRLGGKVAGLAHREGVVGEAGGGTAYHRLPSFHDPVYHRRHPSAAVLCAVDLAAGKPAAGFLRGDGVPGGLLVVHVESVLRLEKLPQGQDLVA